jgi:hypothetical protein
MGKVWGKSLTFQYFLNTKPPIKIIKPLVGATGLELVMEISIFLLH